MPENILETKNISYSYPDGTKALDGVSVRIKKGSKVAVLGSNGAGKSTLFLNLNGVLKPTGGKVYFNGREVDYKRASLTELRKNVGIVFQDPDVQLFSSSVYQEVSFGPMNLRLPEHIVRERVECSLEELGISHLKERPTHFLSYGQKKKVSIADIIAMEPEVIIFDEPTACLDPRNSQQLVRLFDKLNRSGKTVILSTHNVDMAYSWADHVIVMKEGKVEREGMPKDVFRDTDLLESADLIKPFVLEIYDELKKTGALGDVDAIPASREELIGMIRSISFK